MIKASAVLGVFEAIDEKIPFKDVFRVRKSQDVFNRVQFELFELSGKSVNGHVT